MASAQLAPGAPSSGRHGHRWRDLVPALPLLFIGLAGTGRAQANQQGFVAAPDGVAYALVAVAALSLVLRRRAPLVALVATGLAMSGYLALEYPFGPILLTGPAATYAVATRLPARSATAWCAGFAAVTSAAASPHFLGADDAGWRGYLVWTTVWVAVLAAPAAIGAARVVRRRSEAVMRVEQARRAVSEERLAMARDVHDGVGHGLAVIALHAGVALHVLDRDPERARELLTTIRATSRESLEGLRSDLERLRSTGPAGTPEPGARRPAPGVDDLPVLLGRMRDGGLVLHEEVAPVGPLPPDVDAAAYRIVQESLTNVLRHAGETPAWVRVRTDGQRLLVEVRDRGTTPATVTSAGTGITGMRQRAEALGGRLDAGPTGDGGFVVRAELPVTAAVGQAAATRTGGVTT